MDHYAGLDVSLEYSSICVVDANGKVIREGRVAAHQLRIDAGLFQLVKPVENHSSNGHDAEQEEDAHDDQDPDERARRQERLQRLEATMEPLPFDAAAARAYGRVYAATAAAGRKARGRRALDLMIAATALSAQLPVYTCNPTDFEDVAGIIDVVAVEGARRR